MGKGFHSIITKLRNKAESAFLPFVLFAISCNMSSRQRPFNLLTKYSDLHFNQTNVDLVTYKEEMAGMMKNQGIIEGVFKIHNLNIDSLKRETSELSYKKFPIDELDMGDGFNGNVLQSDSGCYRLSLQRRGIIDLLVIVNFTQKKVLFYKLIQ
jgi:hypothetical protein